MSDKYRNMKPSQSDFIRYQQGKMSGEERNSFERELQKDPFASEAEEGLASIPGDEVVNDLSKLHGRLKTRISGKQKLIYYSIAASVTALIAISSMLIIFERNRTHEQISENSVQQKPFEIAQNLPIKSAQIKEQQR